jgi:hypothetical protein
MSAGKLTEAECEALEVGTSLFGWSDSETALRHLVPVVEAILAEREASLRAQIAADIEADPVCHPQDAGAVCPGCQAERIARGGDGA